ncbi:MAG: hypothetical protein WDN04_01090 [Rhodospirillales bacterium]
MGRGRCADLAGGGAGSGQYSHAAGGRGGALLQRLDCPDQAAELDNAQHEDQDDRHHDGEFEGLGGFFCRR